MRYRHLAGMVLVAAAAAAAAYLFVLNAIGPSTEYFDPTIQGATLRPDGKYVAYVGDRIAVYYVIVRHKLNGNCLLNVWRYGEEVQA